MIDVAALVEALAALPDDQLAPLLDRLAPALADRVAPPPAPEYLNPVEAAELLRTTRRRVYDLTQDGRLPRMKVGGRLLVRRADVIALIEGVSPPRV